MDGWIDGWILFRGISILLLGGKTSKNPWSEMKKSMVHIRILVRLDGINGFLNFCLARSVGRLFELAVHSKKLEFTLSTYVCLKVKE